MDARGAQPAGETDERRVVVLGVGNLVMGDEGVGVRCVQQLETEQALPPEVTLLDGGTSTHELLADLENLDVLVIVDAVATASPAGTIVELEGDAIPATFSNTLSPHQHGLHDLLATLRLLGRSPKRLTLVGISPATMTLSLALSPAIEAALPELCRRVVAVVGRA
jgi:hydrogenase maturation protease